MLTIPILNQKIQFTSCNKELKFSRAGSSYLELTHLPVCLPCGVLVEWFIGIQYLDISKVKMMIAPAIRDLLIRSVCGLFSGVENIGRNERRRRTKLSEICAGIVRAGSGAFGFFGPL